MDATIITALAALGGTVIGGLVTFLTSFFLKKAEWREERITRELAKREQLYSDFLAEFARLVLMSISRKTSDKQEFQRMYALLGRIRMCASVEVVEAGERLTKSALHSHKEVTEDSNVDADEESSNDSFSKACRVELDSLQKKS